MKLRTAENRLRAIHWPIGCGKLFKGVYHLYKDETYLYQSGKATRFKSVLLKGLNNGISTLRLVKDLAQQRYVTNWNW